jgi:predicted phosphodiesterase
MKKSCLITLFSILFLCNCATHDLQYKNGSNTTTSSDKEIERTVYLIGDAGNASLGESTDALKAFTEMINTNTSKKDYVVYLGDNIYEKGLPKKDNEKRELAEHRIDVQIEAVKDFKGKVLFIPGNHDWYSNGISGLKRQEKYIEKALDDSNAFQPEKGCPIKKINVSENVLILAIDSQWYLADWDKNPTINDECDIKSRNDFFLEIEGIFKKNNEKTIIVAMHHPTMTNGSHGGKYTANKHLFPLKRKIPLPVIGSLIAQVRSQGGVSPQDNNSKLYIKLMKRLKTLAKGSDKVIFTSGHDHNLQYLESEGVKQIVSGSGSKSSGVRIGGECLFSSGNQGFAVLDVYTDGSSEVRFYGAENQKPTLLFTKEIYASDLADKKYNFNKELRTDINTTAYPKTDTEKSNGYKWFWGNHYRYVYGTDIKVPVVTLDQYKGGFSIERKGGGHQTRSLRLTSNDKRTYALRAVNKSAVQFLQTVAFKDTYIEDDFRETFTEKTILDFYTASHPYATFTIGTLSDALDIYHTNPELFYMPKHNALGKFNEEFGDELYILEERPDDSFLDVESFGKPDAIESSSDVLGNLRKDEKFSVDEDSFIKARLFDMLIGDWDRHQDQWRWSRFNISKHEVVYKPIPRDRDQAFSNYDGALFDFLKAIMPTTDQFQEFDSELKDIKWINLAGIKLDRTFIQKANKESWIAQAKFIQENLTDEVIDNAFSKLPKEVQDDTSNDIKAKLKERRTYLVEIASKYYEYLSKLVILTGTDKDDHFSIVRTDNTTTVSVSRMKNNQETTPFKERVINSGETSEIWIYGLDDDDKFTVSGKGSSPVLVRVVGGQNNDSYIINNGKKVKIYDHKSRPNTIVEKGSASVRLSDVYAKNVYDYNKRTTYVNTITPSLGANPDDGLKVGLQDVFLYQGFKGGVYDYKHTLGASYYFATEGFEVHYEGIISQTFGIWDLVAGVNFTSENYTQNFFGFGNETENFEDDLNLDFNRVKTGLLKGKIGVRKMGRLGSELNISAAFERTEIENTPDRFISDYFTFSPTLFENYLTYSNVNITYSYSSYDEPSNPRRGMNFSLSSSLRNNLDEFEKAHGFIQPKVEFFNSLTKNKRLVLKTMVQGQFLLGDDFEFFQAASLGAGSGLRGFRNQRFSGKSALVVGSDLRYSFRKFKTGLLPLQFGIYGGVDFGRVWVEGEDSNTWHNDFGGGFWINAVDTISGKFGVFNSEEGMRISFGFGIGL